MAKHNDDKKTQSEKTTDSTKTESKPAPTKTAAAAAAEPKKSTSEKKAEPKASSANTPNTTAPAKGSIFGKLSGLLAIGAIAFCVFLFMQQQKMMQELAKPTIDTSQFVTQQALANIRESQEQAQRAALNQIANINTQTELLEQKLKLPEANIVRLEQEIDRINTEVKITKGQLSHLPSSYSDAEIQWLLARSEFLIDTAQDLLTFKQDTSGAVAALQAAESILRQASHPALLALRESLRNDIAVVKAVTLPNKDQLLHDIDALIATTSGLSVEQIPTKWPLKSAASDDIAGAAENAGQKVLNALRGVVDIRRGQRGQALLLGPDEHYILIQNITIRLETAKSALLNNNQATYVGTLKNIQSWIITHFNAKDANVESALASITTLLDNDIAPTLPTLAPSKQQLDLTRQQVTEQTAHVGGAQ